MSDKVSSALGYYFVIAGPFIFSAVFTKENAKITILPLEADDREQFIPDNQKVFTFGAVEKLDMRDDYFE